jgi:hypothetical protein
MGSTYHALGELPSEESGMEMSIGREKSGVIAGLKIVRNLVSFFVSLFGGPDVVVGIHMGRLVLNRLPMFKVFNGKV